MVSQFGGDPALVGFYVKSFSRAYKRSIAMTGVIARANLVLDRKMFVGLDRRHFREGMSGRWTTDRPFSGIGRDYFETGHGSSADYGGRGGFFGQFDAGGSSRDASGG